MSLQLVPRALRYVEEVARHGSIQAASRELGIAASAIDRQILIIEEELGAPLFERHSTGMRPTPVGGLVVSLARRWRSDAGGLFTTVRQMKGLDIGHVRLAAMDSHANGLLPALLTTVSAAYPKVALEIDIMSTDDAVDALMDDRADVALAFNLRARRELHVLWSVDLPLGCTVAPTHALATRDSVSLKEVVAHPIATQSRSLAIRRYLEDKHAWMFSERDPPVVTNSLQLVKQLAVSGAYAAITSELDMAPEILAGNLVFVPISDEAARPQTIAIAISARRPLPRLAQAVAELAKTEIIAVLKAVRD
ncbi:MAG: LysR family transcriptional regulator [Alphaproteobacteria bacterium]